MGNSWGEIIGVFLLATVKYVFGSVPLSVTLFKFSFQKAVIVNTLGGITGSTIFVSLSDRLINYFKEKSKGKPPKKKFTRTNKIIVKTKQRFGLPGIALLTPFILSIPLGCFVATRYFKSKTKILLHMYVSVFLWAVVICAYKLFI